MKTFNIKGSLLVLMVISIAMITSCKLDDGPEPFDALAQFNKEIEAIDAYLDENSIDAEIDTLTLIRYVIHEQGTGEQPAVTDNVNIDYAGRFLSNEEEFDSNEGASFNLSELIPSWRVMIPYINEGGSITFYAPSYYCYGPNGYSSIPGNATLIFDVTLNQIE